eukprot:COSAG04_NODE_1379_length_7006_cov_71.155350_2_plen_118_part_00
MGAAVPDHLGACRKGSPAAADNPDGAPLPPGVRLGTRLSARTCAGRAQQRRLPGGVAALQWRERPSGLSMMWIVAEVLYMGTQPSPVCGSARSAARAAPGSATSAGELRGLAVARTV